LATILVVEDDPIIRQTVDYALRRAGFETRTAADGREALDMARSSPPDLILLDVMLPGMDGFAVAAELRQTDRKVAIIMVTALDQARDKVQGLDAGADDYLTKPFSMEELLARVRANLRRMKERAVLTDDDPITAGAPVRLRLKEFQLLLALAREPERLMSRQRLAAEVWGYEHMASSRTIDVHIRRVRQAIEEISAFDYIQTVHGVGYRFSPVAKKGGTS
jgi:DNA-binding response OmpR family regulator